MAQWTSQRRGARRCWINRSVFAGDTDLDLIDRLVDGGATLVATLKEDGRSLVQAYESGGRRWVVKRYRGPAWKTLAYHLVRRTPAWREWRYVRRLARRGVRVLALGAIVHEQGWGRWSQTIISPYIEASNLHHCIMQGRIGPDQRRPVARAVGRQIGQMSAAGVVNRDHKSSNLLIDHACLHHGDDPLIIDPAAVKRGSSDGRVFRMLAVLALTAEQAGHESMREKMACLRAALQADRSLAPNQPRRLRYAAQKISRQIQWLRRRG